MDYDDDDADVYGDGDGDDADDNEFIHTVIIIQLPYTLDKWNFSQMELIFIPLVFVI